MTSLVPYLMAVAATTFVFRVGKAVGRDIERKRMISAFWAFLSLHAGYTTILNELERLTPDEREMFEGALDEIAARRRGRK